MSPRSLYAAFATAITVLVALPHSAHPQRRPGVPAPQYEVRLEQSVLVHMRDGVRLSTDIYFPVGAEEPLPVVLIRLPYNKNQYMRFRQPGSDAYFFAGQGYVVAVQDMRGRFESEGEYVVGRANRDDGYDTVEWLANQPWSNGRVGTYGCSYLGESQLQLAATRHPNHAAAIPQAAGGGYDGTFRTFLFMDGGAFEVASGLGWFSGAGRKTFNRPSSSLPDEAYREAVRGMNTAPPLPPINLQEAFWHLPVIEVLEHYGHPASDYKDFVSHMPGDPYWKTLNYIDDTDRFDVPAIHVNSWYDLGPRETMDVFSLFRDNAESARGRDNQFVILSPTIHCASEFVRAPVRMGERELGDATLEYYRIYLNWFDHWLKGNANDVTEMPKIQYYLMGANEWRAAEEWPLPGTAFTPFYLHSSGEAGANMYDGVLNLEPPTVEPADSYTYDPANPVPSVGGPICCIGADDAPAGSFDQSEVELRPDVLVYTSDPLDEGIEVTGPMDAVLYVSSSAKDTDFTIKLVDVYPDGRAFNVQETILRARYREGFDRHVFMQHSEVYGLNIDLHATGNYFGPGHRIRIEVSSSNFPRFDRNLNTGGNNYDETSWIVAENTIHHSSDYPSHVILPIVRR